MWWWYLWHSIISDYFYYWDGSLTVVNLAYCFNGCAYKNRECNWVKILRKEIHLKLNTNSWGSLRTGNNVSLCSTFDCPDPDLDHREYTLQGHSCFFFHMKKKFQIRHECFYINLNFWNVKLILRASISKLISYINIIYQSLDWCIL